MSNRKTPQNRTTDSNIDVSKTQKKLKIVSKRINSLDFFKGFAIIVVYFYHLSHYWLTKQWSWVNCATLFFSDVFGPSLFLFVSGLAVTFSAKRKEGKVPRQVIRNRTFTRGLLLMLISAPFNIYLSLTNDVIYNWLPFPINLWGYNIIFFIGLSQIVSYISYRLGKKLSVILGLFIIFLGPFIREIVFFLNIEMLSENNFNFLYFLLHYIFTSPIPQLPLFPWISICFISSIFGEILYDAWNEGTAEKIRRAFQVFLISGIIFVSVSILYDLAIRGIFYDFALYTPDNLSPVVYPYIKLMDCANKQTILPGPLYIGIPGFLVRSTSANMLYLMGVALIFIGLGLYLLDLKRKTNSFINMGIFYGRISLSLYLLVEFFAFMFSGVYPLWFFIIFYISTTAFVGFLLYLWRKYFENIGSFEWIVGKSCMLVQNYTYRRLKE
jgi:uncharacterized membrane protein